jgi:hypothetical protein
MRVMMLVGILHRYSNYLYGCSLYINQLYSNQVYANPLHLYIRLVLGQPFSGVQDTNKVLGIANFLVPSYTPKASWSRY